VSKEKRTTLKHPLTKYLQEHRESPKSFARRICIDEQMLELIMQGHIIPSMTIIRQICVETDNQLILNDFFRFSTNYLEDQNEESQHSEPKVANIIDISSFRRQAETSNKIPPGGDIDTIMLAEILAFSFARLKKKSKGGFNAHSLLITAEAVSMTYCAL